MIEKVYGLHTTGVTLNARFTILAAQAGVAHRARESNINSNACCSLAHSTAFSTMAANGPARQKFGNIQRANSTSNFIKQGLGTRTQMHHPLRLRLLQQQRHLRMLQQLQQQQQLQHQRQQQQAAMRIELFARLSQRRSTQGQRVSNIARWYAYRAASKSAKVSGKGGQQSRPNVTSQQLDAELEQYMSCTKVALDRQLEEYMARADEPFAS